MPFNFQVRMARVTWHESYDPDIVTMTPIVLILLTIVCLSSTRSDAAGVIVQLLSFDVEEGDKDVAVEDPRLVDVLTTYPGASLRNTGQFSRCFELDKQRMRLLAARGVDREIFCPRDSKECIKTLIIDLDSENMLKVILLVCYSLLLIDVIFEIFLLQN